MQKNLHEQLVFYCGAAIGIGIIMLTYGLVACAWVWVLQHVRILP